MEFGVEVQNMVAKTDLETSIDLRRFVSAVTGMEYNPENFPGVIYRLKEPKMALLIFSSGKVVITGATEKSHIKLALSRLKEKLEEADIACKKEPLVEIENIVASAELGVGVNLDLLALESFNVEYEPEQFPGLVYRLEDPKTTILVFRSGKIVITGAKSLDVLESAALKTKQMVEEVGAVFR